MKAENPTKGVRMLEQKCKTDESIKELIEAGSGIAGSAVGAAIGLLLGGGPFVPTSSDSLCYLGNGRGGEPAGVGPG